MLNDVLTCAQYDLYNYDVRDFFIHFCFAINKNNFFFLHFIDVNKQLLSIFNSFSLFLS